MRIEHDSGTVLKAQTLIDGGWSAYKVAQMLGVSRTTVRRWTDPEYEAHRRQREADNMYRRRRRSGARWGRQHFRPETRFMRMRELYDAGLSLAAIAKVMNLDFEVDLSPEVVRYSLKENSIPRELRAGSPPRSARVEVGGRG